MELKARKAFLKLDYETGNKIVETALSGRRKQEYSFISVVSEQNNDDKKI